MITVVDALTKKYTHIVARSSSDLVSGSLGIGLRGHEGETLVEMIAGLRAKPSRGKISEIYLSKPANDCAMAWTAETFVVWRPS